MVGGSEGWLAGLPACCLPSRLLAVLLPRRPPQHPPPLRLRRPAGMGQSTLLLYNTLLTLPLMAAYLVLGTNELAGVAAYPQACAAGAGSAAVPALGQG